MVKDSERLRLLVLGRRVLHPLETPRRLRLFHLLQGLRQRHQVTYLAFRLPGDSSEAVAAARQYAQEPICVTHRVKEARSVRLTSEVAFNAFVGRHPYVAAKSFSWPMQKRLKSLLQEREFDLLVATELSVMVNLLELHDPPRAPVLLLHPQLESLEWKRRAEEAAGLVRRRALARQHQRIEHFENICAAFVRGQVTVSPADGDYLRHVRGMENVLGHLPPAVDGEFFGQRAALPEPGVFAFAGDFSTAADRQGAEFFVSSVLPLVQAQWPRAQFLIVGPHPPSDLVRTAEKDQAVTVTGAVADIRPLMAGATALVVPVRSPGGMRLETLEAMAMGVPVITTHAGADGLPAELAEPLLKADSAEGLAALCLRVLQDPSLARRSAAASRTAVETHARWSTAIDRFEEFCLQCAAGPLPARL